MPEMQRKEVVVDAFSGFSLSHGLWRPIFCQKAGEAKKTAEDQANGQEI